MFHQGICPLDMDQMCTCTKKCTLMCVHIHAYIVSKHACTHAFMHVHACIHTQTHTCEHMHVHTHTCASTCMHVHTHTHTHADFLSLSFFSLLPSLSISLLSLSLNHGSQPTVFLTISLSPSLPPVSEPHKCTQILLCSIQHHTLQAAVLPVTTVYPVTKAGRERSQEVVAH